MKKIIASILWGYALTVNALTSGEMDQDIANQTALPIAKVKTALDLFELRLKSEAASGKAVKLDGLGTFFPRRVSGTRTGRTLGGGTVTYPNWKLVKNPVVVSDTTLYSTDMGVTQNEYDTILTKYKSKIRTEIDRGAVVRISGFGTYKRVKKMATNKLPLRKVATFHSTPKGMHQKFVPEWTPWSQW